MHHGPPSRTFFQVMSALAPGLALFLLLLQTSYAHPQQREFPPPHTNAAALAQLVQVIVPDVRGQTPENAQSMLTKAGLKLGSRTVASGPGAAGTVWGQNPAANSKVRYGTTVNVQVVPQGQPAAPTHGDEEFRRRVPMLTGETPEQARQTLARVGLKLGSVSVGKGVGAEGTIFSQEPAAGQWVQVLSSVNVRTVPQDNNVPTGTSDGFAWKIVPSLRGLTTEEASQTLTQSGLQMGSASAGAARVPAGTIFGQEPQPNTKVRPGTAVSVWVAQVAPPKPVIVPNLIHLDPRRAQAVLQRARLALGNVAREESDNFIGLIAAQSPPPGTQVKASTPVSITVATEMPLVTVPDLVKRDEAAATATLNQVGLALGTLAQRDSDEASGTILTQKPAGGTQVRKGSKVDVVVSRQILRSLVIMTDDPNPEIGKRAKFHAHLTPEDMGFRYRFDFGDGPAGKWQSQSTTTHLYQTSGSYRVRAVAMRGTTEVRSEPVDITPKEVEFTVALKANPVRAKPGTDIVFLARVSRLDILPNYQFVFEDGTKSNWSPEASTHRRYEKWGTYVVKVRARVALGRIKEGQTEVPVGPPLPLVAGLAVSVAALGAGAVFAYSGWKKFLRWVHTKPGIDVGRQRVNVLSPEGWGEAVSIRLVSPPGIQGLVWVQRQDPAKGGAHG